ncbi:hypothetical protein PBY51_018524 [Eleginops maclovinus]|uniref:Uncharacterized protein n=1 Tax=Eleginops maclovinus TaxID=56733 RepID=A0AAN8AY99_ELEMC|nr:hypothetical protein PBY51_018524 [Eleginops maclovinus]
MTAVSLSLRTPFRNVFLRSRVCFMIFLWTLTRSEIQTLEERESVHGSADLKCAVTLHLVCSRLLNAGLRTLYARLYISAVIELGFRSKSKPEF